MNEIKIPALGESVGEVAIGSWLKNEGDAVAKDENVVVIESDKATLELTAPAAGVLAEIRRHAGETAAVGEVIGRIEVSQRSDTEAVHHSKAQPQTGTAANSEERLPSAADEKNGPGMAAEKTEAQPETRRAPRPIIIGAIAEERSDGNGAEPGQRKDTTARPEPKPKPGASKSAAEENHRAKKESEQRERPQQGKDTDFGKGDSPLSGRGTIALQRHERAVPLSPVRRAIAKRLVQAKQEAALLTTFNEIDMSAVKALREQERDHFQEKHGTRLGYMSFFVKAAVAGLKLVPQLNAELRGDTLVYHEEVNIGIAVGSGKGLVVPVLRGADRLSFAEIEKQIADFARRAEENRLSPQDFENGTFTISNGGIYGSLLSTPIVNPPQSAILGMHAIIDRPIASNGSVVVRPMMYVALTYDHRTVDGREAVQFLRHVKECIEVPARLLLEV
jgi:2-oxoglutarate dehydrogenase E2 component (dihydrolipoamide succinyltransferase)